MMNLRRDVFQAIADPTCRAILLLVTFQSMAAGAIASNLTQQDPAVSKHLQMLKECKLLKQEQNGREMYYHINAKKMKEVADFLSRSEKCGMIGFKKLESVMKPSLAYRYSQTEMNIVLMIADHQLKHIF